MSTTFATILAELADPTAVADSIRHAHNVFALADDAGCMSPDSDSSPGAAFLARIARDVAETVEGYIDANPDERPDSIDLGDMVHEIADGAVPIYTHERWQTFVDLGAYNEDPASELADDGSDLTQTAGAALYLIATRLVAALAEELSDALDEDEPAEEWAYDSGYETPAQQVARVRELVAARPEIELRTTKSEGGIYEVHVRIA